MYIINIRNVNISSSKNYFANPIRSVPFVKKKIKFIFHSGYWFGAISVCL